MRQLKGKVKETRKQKKERKEENLKIHQQLTSIVLPTIGIVIFMVILYVYVKTRPKFEL
ncbi:single-pass membrane and coiled-coil domain-containing protein 4 homolog [Hermetia illucens]|uniref:single-pass membrane and coiled-coil domain-containing protein 4 homolog n=1 Tax=Hermetia illucens TaxID=343691 RepID=UPI0018CC3A92|nr:single-pass membrane and coiled-coil domain-containing protein 4 homolog [Hermetia illucens]XP_037925141.1 single-pass membrane and coiled-coil domain-containing protein 4 homolog [Hermetia illucens]XP_037925143.1 single-pass membrane and coiled-coil domain-containing protein 4 homolog [Hermetia illucens]